MKLNKLILLLALAVALLIGTQAALAQEEEPSGVDLEIYALGDGMKEKGEDYAYDVGYHLHDLKADAVAEAGAFVARRPDGTTVGGYGVTVGGNARYTAAEGFAQGTVGYDDFNLHGNGTIAAGEMKAGADFTAGVVDGNLRVVVEGGGELNAFSACGSAGVNIDGVNVNVNGGVKVGLGAKAYAGYQDGVFKADVMVAAGLGLEIGFEVDVGAIEEKMEEAVVDMAKETVKNMAETVKTIETVKAVGEVTQNVITEVFKRGWDFITGWF